MNTSKKLGNCITTRRERRVTLNCEAILTEADGFNVDVTLVDVSKDGFRLRSLTDLEVGSKVTLQMHDAAAVRGQIRWICGHEAGGVFLDPVIV